MQDFFNSAGAKIAATSSEEWIAVVASLLYVWMAARQVIWCWIFAIISSAIYVHLCFISHLYADTALQSLYVLLAFWGWINWNKGRRELQIGTWSLNKNLVYIVLCAACSLLIGFTLDTYTDQVFPYIDSAIFCYSLFATYLISIKILENWLYFVAVDLVAIPLFMSREFYLTALLYIAYTLIALDGYRKWRKEFKSLGS